MAELLPIVFAVAGGLFLLLVLLAAWQSVRVLLGGDGPARETAESSGIERRALEREKSSLLSAIRELRFEHDVGKLSQGDLTQLEQRYRGRAREVLRLLDEEIEPHRNAARELIEAERSRQEGVPALAKAAAAEPSRASSACDACGTRNDADAQFCKKCGKKLGAETPA